MESPHGRLVSKSLVATRQVTYGEFSLSLVLFFQAIQQTCFATGYATGWLLLQGHAQYFKEASALRCELLEARVEQLSREKERLEYDRNVRMGPLHTPTHPRRATAVRPARAARPADNPCESRPARWRSTLRSSFRCPRQARTQAAAVARRA